MVGAHALERLPDLRKLGIARAVNGIRALLEDTIYQGLDVGECGGELVNMFALGEHFSNLGAIEDSSYILERNIPVKNYSCWEYFYSPSGSQPPSEA